LVTLADCAYLFDTFWLCSHVYVCDIPWWYLLTLYTHVLYLLTIFTYIM